MGYEEGSRVSRPRVEGDRYNLDSSNIIFSFGKEYMCYYDGKLISFSHPFVCGYFEKSIEIGLVELICTHGRTLKLYKPKDKITLVGDEVDSDAVITSSYTSVRNFKVDSVEEFEITEELIKEIAENRT